MVQEPQAPKLAGARMKLGEQMTGRQNWLVGAAVCGSLLAAACHRPAFLGGKPQAPTGEVVATVDGHEITLRQLQAELQGAQTANPAQMKALQQRALQAIVIRTLIADEARKQGIDKTPDFALQRDRLTDNLLAQMLQAKTAKAVPEPTPEEIQRFISDHADIFAQRKIYDVEQIRFARPADPAVVRGLGPLNSMDQIAAYLTSKNIQAARGEGRLDVVGLDPNLVDKIGKLPANQPFVLSAGNLLVVNQIKSSQIAPLSGADANKYATALLTRQHGMEAVQREGQTVVAEGMKRVAFNAAYAPPSAPKAAPVGGGSTNTAANTAQ
jgi:peptidyl-prolyl cis-trans isomerase C